MLQDGAVLIAGGGSQLAAVYDPARRQFDGVGNMAYQRVRHTATHLPDGRVLMAGGFGKDPRFADPPILLANAEIYDPVSQTFSPTGSMGEPREEHVATPLNDGTVLITGGKDGLGAALLSAELYDPALNIFIPVGNMSSTRFAHSATPLPDGTVLIAARGNSADIYDPITRRFDPTGSMGKARWNATATALADGRVLFTGGANLLPSTSAEIYDYTRGSFSRPTA